MRAPPALLRWSLFALGVALTLSAGLSFQLFRQEVHGLDAELDAVLPVPASPRAEALPRLDRDPDPAAARALAARALVAEALRETAAGRPYRRSQVVARLDLARSLAARALAERPSSSVAAMVLGASTYLARSLGRDPRLLTEPEAWEAPLERALALAPGRDEAQRFLAMAYLELWAFLPESKKARTRELVAVGLADPETFDRLIEPWLAVAPEREAALALLPEEPFAWERLARLYAGRGDWPGYARAFEGHWAALERDVGRRLAAAEGRLAAGDAGSARSLALGALRDLPVDGRFAGLLARAMTLLPPGGVGAEEEARMAEWLAWALDLCLLRDCPLPPPVLGRLANAAPPAEAPTAAAVALAAEDLAGAERIERRAGGTYGQEEWASYLILKARRLAARGDSPGARACLDAVHWSRHGDPLYLVARLDLARRFGDRPAEEEARRALARLRRAAWPAAAWRERRGEAVLTVVPARPATRLALEIAPAAEGGGAAALRWDGTTTALFAIGPGPRVHAVAAEAGDRLHRLEVRRVAGHPGVPGAVSLYELAAGEPDPPSTASPDGSSPDG